jgi:late competence protein required for DNA uptake (superfamily II DNA/RNA helicase)
MSEPCTCATGFCAVASGRVFDGKLLCRECVILSRGTHPRDLLLIQMASGIEAILYRLGMMGNTQRKIAIARENLSKVIDTA